MTFQWAEKCQCPEVILGCEMDGQKLQEKKKKKKKKKTSKHTNKQKNLKLDVYRLDKGYHSFHFRHVFHLQIMYCHKTPEFRVVYMTFHKTNFN